MNPPRQITSRIAAPRLPAPSGETDGTARKTLSIVVPVHNEGAGVARLHGELLPTFRELDQRLAIDVEMIFVDDGSQDDTLDHCLRLVEEDPRCVALELSRNFGKEAAMSAGLDAARGDAAVVIDGDMQDPPELIVRMVEHWLAGAEVVVAKRVDRSTDSVFKRWTARGFYRLFNFLSHYPIPADVGDFRLMDRVVLDALARLPERTRFMKGLFAWVGFKTETVEYTRQARAEGESKFSGWRLWNFALDGIAGFSTVPLRVWTYFGVCVAGAAFLYLLFIMYLALFEGIDLPGYASQLVTLLFFGGLQLISIGVIGEYVGRIFIEVKQRPLYLVRRRHAGAKPPAAEMNGTGDDGGRS